jgi:hypothetical protein
MVEEDILMTIPVPLFITMAALSVIGAIVVIIGIIAITGWWGH